MSQAGMPTHEEKQRHPKDEDAGRLEWLGRVSITGDALIHDAQEKALEGGK